jgi:hypothetical protein
MKLAIESFSKRILRPALFLSVASASMLACGSVDQGATESSESTRTTAAALSTDGGSDAGALITISGTVADSMFPQAGIVITLSGSAQGQVVTDFSGAYSFSVKPGGSYSLTSRGSNFFAPPFSTCLSITPDVVNLNNLKTSTVINFLGTGNNFVLNCAPAEVMGATTGPLTVSGVVTSGGAPVPGVVVSLSGGTQAIRVTDETGAYSFAVNAGSYSVNLSGPCSSFSPSVTNLNNIKSNTVANFTGASCPPAPLTLCPEFDTDFGLTEPASCNVSSSEACAGDRLLTWANTIENDWFTINTDDCRFGTWNNPPIVNLFEEIGIEQDIDFINLYALQLFGCGLAGNITGPLGFPFILTDLQSLKFTTADLAALSDEYVQAIEQTLSDNGSPALTPAQITAIQAQLASAASRVKGITQSSQLSFSTCLPDGGAP